MDEETRRAHPKFYADSVTTVCKTGRVNSVETAAGQLLEELWDAAILVEAATGCILRWNSAAESLFGYSAEEAASRSIESVIDGATSRRGGPTELLARRKDGNPLWIELSVSPLAGEGRRERCLLLIVRDATHRNPDGGQRANLAALGTDVGSAITSSGSMQQVLARIALAVTVHLRVAVVKIWTLHDDEAELELQASAGHSASGPERHHRIRLGELGVGCIASEREARITNDLLSDADGLEKKWLEREELVAFAGFPLIVEEHVAGVLGIYSCHAIDARALDGLPGVLDIISQYIVRKRAVDALRRNAARFRALIEHSSDMISLHRADATITYVSPSASRLVGYAPESLIGRNLLDDVHPDDRLALAAAIAEHVKTPGAVSTGRYRLRHRDGSWRWIDATATNLLDEPAVTSIVVNRHDVTAEVKAHQLLEDRVSERTRELLAVLELARDLASTLELGPLLNLLLDRLQLLVPYTGAGILVVDGDRLYQRAHRSALPAAEGLRVTYPIEVWQEAWQQLAGGEPILIRDTHSDCRPAEIWRMLVGTPEQAAYRHTIRTCLWAPLVVRDRLIGVLAVTSNDVDAFTDHQAELAAAAASHAAFAIENARLYEAARGTAALQERQRLARELHDSVSQVLYAIALSAAAARQLCTTDSSRAYGMLDEMHQLAQTGLTEMRALIFELRPESLEHDGLVCALERQAAALETRHRLPVARRLCAEPKVPMPIKEVVYRVAQEALHNAAKHARAGHLELQLSHARGQLVLRIGDDGRGFVPNAAFPGHLGLRSMRERAAVVGGTLEISSAPGKGTRVSLRVPFTEDLKSVAR
jgi:PAS domain S-box-containing protein